MGLALSDIKKTFSHRGGEIFVLPRLLRPHELLSELEALVALYESFVGCERAGFPLDRAAELVGDYRLARCLAVCLGEWYEWHSPPWPGAASEPEAAALAAQGISSPSALRLALFDHVNATSGGFLAAPEREAVLDAFAGERGITRQTFDTLLALDVEAHAALARLRPQSPTAVELSRRYNQRAVEAMLANASTVEWVLLPQAAEGAGGGLGTVVKRVCFLARRMGVQYDVAFDVANPLADPLEDDSEAAAEHVLARVAETPVLYSVPETDSEASEASDPLGRAGRPLVVTLYGPHEVTGAPMQYGERLAMLCRALLGYHRAEDVAGHAALSGRGLSGRANVYVQGRPMVFPMDERLLRLLRGHTSNRTSADGEDTMPVAFDSALEQRLHTEFAALERVGEARGWHLEREPEPLLLEDTIIVPDFALSRGPRRVYLEIAGYWRPDYRERKARKLARLRGAVLFILAAPDSARAAFEALGASIPLLWYKDYVRAHTLLALLDREFDDAEQRLASLALPAIRCEVALRGCIAPTESLTLLRCYTRNEAARAVECLGQDAATAGEAAPVWIDGVGLCAAEWLAVLLSWLRAQLDHATDGRLPVDEVRSRLAAHAPALAHIGEPEVETLVGLVGLRVARPSIFEASVMLESGQEPAAPTHEVATPKARSSQPRKPPGRRHSGTTTETRPLFADVEREG
jgi:predicted nuclease of restriction endonuclease-like RecB superfamily